MNLGHLYRNNQNWAAAIKEEEPGFFEKLVEQQNPEYLWIGCSDSRVPANEIVGMLPGELFVHRNVANLVQQTDFNCLSVLQYAVDVLQVKCVIVCGHYGCGGIRAALGTGRLGLIDNWLHQVRELYVRHAALVDRQPDEAFRVDKLCELNVLEQAMHVAGISVMKDAWNVGQSITLHAMIYGIHDGILRDLGFTVSDPSALDANYQSALKRIAEADGRVA